MTTTKFLRSPAPLAASLLMAGLPLSGFAQVPAAAGGSAAPTTVWQQCTALSDGPARLACFDQWAQQQSRQPLLSQQAAPAATTPPASANAMQGLTPPAGALAAADIPAPIGGCRNDGYTEMSRFWELEAGTDCGTFSFRGYRPLSVSVAVGDKVNRQPTSLNPVNSATTETDYQRQEMRIQLSVRTKLAQNLLTDPNGKLRDSLWIGYTGLSYWQVFNSDLSRPFRTTDHQPEIFYVYPTTAQLPFGWRWRYSGIGLEHQSNGQSDPLSRSWNRTYLMTGFELDNRWQLQAKIWHRINESAEDDNNPNIQNYIGRSELKLGWNVNQRNWMGVTARGSLNGHGKGSGRVEWMHTLGDGWMGGKSNLRLHAQVFHGYGDSLIDYNYKRTVFSLGFSLLDF